MWKTHTKVLRFRSIMFLLTKKKKSQHFRLVKHTDSNKGHPQGTGEVPNTGTRGRAGRAGASSWPSSPGSVSAPPSPAPPDASRSAKTVQGRGRPAGAWSPLHWQGWRAGSEGKSEALVTQEMPGCSRARPAWPAASDWQGMKQEDAPRWAAGDCGSLGM